MRWKRKEPPRWGDYREHTKFAFLPITLNHETRWLEKVTLHQTAERSGWGLMARWYWKSHSFVE
jgi:hypothetical protein